jgi:anhydro-N-acetylmuramic acid kinase
MTGGNPKPMRVLGLMSGTSCDGVTLAEASIGWPPGAPRVRCLAWRGRADTSALRARLLRAAEPGGADAAEVAALHVERAEFWAAAAARTAECLSSARSACRAARRCRR